MSLLDIIIFFPVLVAIAIGLGAPARTTAVSASLINLLGILFAVFLFKGAELTNGFAFSATRALLPQLNINYSVGADGLTIVLLLLTGLVTLAAVWCTNEGTRLHYVGALLMSAGALGAFCSRDLFCFYGFHELALIPTFLIIGLFGSGDKKEAAWKITLYLGLGSLVLLGALIYYVYTISGGHLTFDMQQLRDLALASKLSAATLNNLILWLVLGFGVLISLWPFHSWAAPAYSSAPAPIAMLHAGVLKKFGIYGLLRLLTPLLAAQTHPLELWSVQLMLGLLLGNVILIGWVCIAQKELGLLVGNSSVMHMGYAFLGLASAGSIGAQGVVMLMFAHGLSVSILLALSGMMRDRTGNTSFDSIGGLAKIAPNLTLLFGFAAFASIGLPGFGNFAAELIIFFGAFDQFHPMTTNAGFGMLQIVTIIALWGVVISAVYMLRAFRTLFFGETVPPKSFTDITWEEKWPLVMLLAALLLVGFFPNLLLSLSRESINLLTGSH